MYWGMSKFALSEGRTLNWNKRPAAYMRHSVNDRPLWYRDTHHMPLNVYRHFCDEVKNITRITEMGLTTVEGPVAWVVRLKPQDHPRIRGNDDRVAPEMNDSRLEYHEKA